MGYSNHIYIIWICPKIAHIPTCGNFDGQNGGKVEDLGVYAIYRTPFSSPFGRWRKTSAAAW